MTSSSKSDVHAMAEGNQIFCFRNKYPSEVKSVFDTGGGVIMLIVTLYKTCQMADVIPGEWPSKPEMKCVFLKCHS